MHEPCYNFVNFLFQNSESEDEAAQKEAKEMMDEVEKQGVLKTIIKKACEMSEEALADLGRGGKRGYLAFRELTTEKEGETQDVANFRQSLNSRLQASEALSSALEEQLTRRFPKHLRWDRKAVAGPTVKTIAHRMTYVTGEILRRFKK